MRAPDAEASILAEQAAYYRDRAAEYDEWWFRQGRYDRGPEINAAWFAERDEVEHALAAFLAERRPRDALELACGTGLFTRQLAQRVARVTAVDASPEVIALNRARVASANVAYVQADLFDWSPPARYDLVFMSFWLSHVPQSRFDPLWAMVRGALCPGGVAYLIDSALDSTSTARDHAPPAAAAGVVTRKLNDGRTFRIVKIFHAPDALNARLAGCGFDAKVVATPRYFIHGTARPIEGG